MAPAPSSLDVPASNSSSDHLRSFHRRILNFSRHTLALPSVFRRGHTHPRAPDTVLQPPMILDGPSPLPPDPTPIILSEQLAPTPTENPYIDSQPQSTNQPGDVPGNIVVAVLVAVLILGGLVGLVIGGEIHRRRAKTTKEERSELGLGCCRRKKSRLTKHRKQNATSSPSKGSKANNESFSYDDKTSSPLTRPSAAVSRDRRGRLSGVWPIRGLSQALRGHRRVAKVVAPSHQRVPQVASPQTTWSEFTPATLYAAPPRTFLPGIPEEREEDRRSQADSDFAIMLGVALQRSCPDLILSTQHASGPESSGDVIGRELTETGMQRASEEHQIVCNDDAINEGSTSFESSAPDMTSDGEESSRSSMVSLEGNLGEEVFELRRVHTRSMQMNKGVLLSLSMKTLEDKGGVGVPHEEQGCTSPRVSAFELEAGVSKACADSGLTLEMLGGSFSAINLDEFPSPPSILPMIPSFVSSF